MADNDLIFQIIAEDRYKAQLEEARAAVDRMSEAERQQIVTAHDAAQADDELGKATKDVGDSAKEGAQGFESFKGTIVAFQAGIQIASEAISVAIGTVKQAWDFAKEGAQIQRVGEQFNQVASDFGVSGDKLVSAMDRAAHGTVDDEELMQTATRALTQGVITSQDQLVKFTEIARASAVRFGGDTSQALQSILYATEVGAARQLKATVGVVDFTKSYEALAQQLGKRKQDLTDEEQLQARVNAVLEKGDELVKKVGTSTEDTATRMERFDTRVRDLGDRLHELAANAIGPALQAGADFELMQNQNADASERLAAAQRILESGWSSQQSALAHQLIPELTNLANKEKDALSISDNLDAGTRSLTRSQEEAAHAAQQLADAQTNVGRGAYAMNGALDESNRALVRTRDAAANATLIMDELKTGMGAQLQTETENFSTKQGDLAKKSADLRAQIDQLQASQGRAVTINRNHSLSANELTLAQLKLGEAQTRLGQETDPLKQAELRVQIDKQKESLDNATGSVTSYIDNSKKIKELEGQYDALNKEIDANAAAHEEATKKILFGYAEQQLAVGGLTETEARALDALAVKWGLKSQEDVTAMQNIRNAAQALSQDGSIDEFTATVGANLDKVNSDYEETQGKVTETQQSIQRATSGLAAAGIPIPVSADTSKALTDVEDAKKKITSEPIVLTAKLTITEQAKAVAGDSLAERAAQVKEQNDTLKGTAQTATSATSAIKTAAQDAIDSSGKLASATAGNITTVADRLRSKMVDVTSSVISAVNTMAGQATGDLNQIQNYVDRLPTYKELIYHIKVTGAEDIPSAPTPTRGAQHGADFVVPPNPRGGSGDYFPVMAAPGERVIVTPAGKTAAASAQAAPSITNNNNTYNLYDALAAKQVTEAQRLERLKSVVGAM